jgi:hypothetical protein
VRSADGTTVLGTSASATAPACPVLHHTFPAAGDYRVVLKQRAPNDCNRSVFHEFYVQLGRSK